MPQIENENGAFMKGRNLTTSHQLPATNNSLSLIGEICVIRGYKKMTNEPNLVNTKITISDFH